MNTPQYVKDIVSCLTIPYSPEKDQCFLVVKKGDYINEKAMMTFREGETGEDDVDRVSYLDYDIPSDVLEMMRIHLRKMLATMDEFMKENVAI